MSKTDEKSVITKIKNSSFYRKIEQDTVNEVLAKRTGILEEIKLLKVEQATTIPKIQEDLKKKEAEYEKLQSRLKRLILECNQAKLNLWNTGDRLARKISQQEDLLIESADPRIDEAILFFRDRLDWLRKPGRISSSVQGSVTNPITMIKQTEVYTNKDAVLAQMAYCQNAIKVLGRLKLLSSLPAKMIDDIKSNMPSIDNFSDVTTEKSINSGVSLGTMLRLKEKDMDRNLARLCEKVDKHLNKGYAGA